MGTGTDEGVTGPGRVGVGVAVKWDYGTEAGKGAGIKRRKGKGVK